MSVANTVERSLDERRSSSALLVLGMHRSGTSAITGALGLCGAWVGEETELTGANAENPRGFWERRDMRRICDRLLQAAGADWWKVASFDPKAIPHAILAEERRRFERIIAALDEHGTWVVKEPRLCLLLPLLRDHIDNPICIHIFRNPLEVARSLQSRNGFSIAAGLALWEAYNRRALSASKNLPRLLVSNESLMLRPVETTDGLVGRLDELAVSNLVRPTEDRIKLFINPSLYRRRATEEETDEYLTPSQRTLWQQFRSDHVSVRDGSASISRVTKQHLFDLESAQRSLNHHKDRVNEQSAELTERAAKIKARDVAIKARDATIRALKRRTEELNDDLKNHVAIIENRDRKIDDIFNSTSWKISAPLRIISRGCRWFLRNLRRVFVFMYWTSTGQFPRAISAAFPYYERFAPRILDKLMPKWFRNYAKTALSVSNMKFPDELEKNPLSSARARIKAAEMLFWNDDLSEALVRWRELRTQFVDDEAMSGRAKLMVSVISRLSQLAQYKNQIERYAEFRELRPRDEIKIAIYVAITDNYDSIKLPEHLNPAFDYILFTDCSVPDTGIWQIRPITYFNSEKARTARFVKTHPHTLLSDYDVAVWIDSNIMILDDMEFLIRQFLSSGKALGAVPHPSRESIYEEIISCTNRGKDEVNVMREQMAKYKRESFSHCDLIESNFMIFNLRHEEIDRFLNDWWRELDLHSKRDQLSLNYALSKVGLDWHRLMNHPDSMRNHGKFAFVPHDGGVGPNAKLIEALRVPVVDPYDGPSYAEVKVKRLRGQRAREIDIIVCVHNALDDVRRCFESIRKTRGNSRHRLIIVDDGSEKGTAEYLMRFVSAIPYCELHRNDSAQGYPKAANKGLAASNGELVILLNSDTIVTNSWAEKISDAIFSTPGAGIVGPLSNAASYQSIPEYRGAGSQTAVNVLPPDLTPEDMNGYCERWTAAHILPLTPLVHGFCFGITRQVIEKIGYFDVERFPRGYGEENDYCFRATEAGFSLVIATHTYVFHAKSKSYTDHKRIPLMKSASRTFRQTYGHSRIRRAQNSMAENPILVKLRAHAVECGLDSYNSDNTIRS